MPRREDTEDAMLPVSVAHEPSPSTRLPFSVWAQRLPRVPVRWLDLSAQVRGRARGRDPVTFRNPSSSVLRGLLGEGLRRRLCPEHSPEHRREGAVCLYARLFETPGCWAPGARGDDALRPYWFTGVPGGRVLDAGPLSVRLGLVGPAAEHADLVGAVFADSLASLGPRGAVSIEGQRWSEGVVFGRILPPARRWVLNVRTPLIISPTGEDASRCSAAPWLGAIVRAAARRVVGISRAYGSDFEGRLDYPDLDGTVVRSGGIERRTQLRHRRHADDAHPLEGLTGRVEIEGDGMLAAGPLLALAAPASIGQHPSMGFGSFDIWPHAPATGA